MKKSMISEFMEKESDSKNLFHVIKHVAPVPVRPRSFGEASRIRKKPFIRKNHSGISRTESQKTYFYVEKVFLSKAGIFFIYFY